MWRSNVRRDTEGCGTGVERYGEVMCEEVLRGVGWVSRGMGK